MMCRCYDEEDDRISCWFRFLLGALAALLLSGMLLCGCMTITISDSLLIGSTVNMDKPIDAGISTTGKDLGEAIKAAGFGNPIDLGEIKSILEEYRRIRTPVAPQSRIHPLDMKRLKTRATA